MALTPEEIRAEYSKRRRRQGALAGASVAVLAGMLVLLVRGEGASPWFIAGACVVAGLAVAALRNWRCPACGRYLGRRPRLGACPGCGVDLE